MPVATLDVLIASRGGGEFDDWVTPAQPELENEAKVRRLNRAMFFKENRSRFAKID